MADIPLLWSPTGRGRPGRDRSLDSDGAPRKDVIDAAPTPALGKPQRKPLFDALDLVAVTISVASLIASICVITPHLSLSWKLGFENQIVVIGFLLSIMNLCMKRILPTLFLVLEARWGSSSLQNYDAILRNTVTLSHTGILWRTSLLLLIALPLGLSVAYKRFLGGFTTTLVQSTYPGHYGLAPPPMGPQSVVNNSIYLGFNATIPFLVASASDATPPPFVNLPMAFGFNTLLLSNTSAAILDVPVPDYLTSVQQNLSATESWLMTATVNGSVATLDSTADAYRGSDAFWNEAFNASQGGMWSWTLYDKDNLGVLVGINASTQAPFCLIGYYRGTQNGESSYPSPDDDESKLFRPSAVLFNIARQRCAGTWEVTSSSATLQSGNCSGEATNQTVFDKDSLPFYLDAMPVLVHALTQYAPAQLRKASPWLTPSFAVNIAAMFWSRIIWLSPVPSHDDVKDSEIYYAPANESLSSTTATLDASPLLYLVLILQPVLTIVGFAVVSALHRVPIGKGFGLVAILAGIEKEGLALLKGAAFSGEVQKPVNIDIAVHEPEQWAATGRSVGRVQYALRTHQRGRMTSLRKRRLYE